MFVISIFYKITQKTIRINVVLLHLFVFGPLRQRKYTYRKNYTCSDIFHRQRLKEEKSLEYAAWDVKQITPLSI